MCSAGTPAPTIAAWLVAGGRCCRLSSWRNSAVKPFRSTSGHSDNVVVVVTAICPRAGASESAAACKSFYGIKSGIGGAEQPHGVVNGRDKALKVAINRWPKRLFSVRQRLWICLVYLRRKIRQANPATNTRLKGSAATGANLALRPTARSDVERVVTSSMCGLPGDGWLAGYWLSGRCRCIG